MKKCILNFCLLTLSGCSGYSETFDCAPSKGIGCTSLSAVNRMVETGALPVLDDSDKKEEEKDKKIKQVEKREDDLSQLISVHSSKEKNDLSTLTRNRLRVWMAAYKDSAGYDHEAAYVLGKPHYD